MVPKEQSCPGDQHRRTKNASEASCLNPLEWWWARSGLGEQHQSEAGRAPRVHKHLKATAGGKNKQVFIYKWCGSGFYGVLMMHINYCLKTRERKKSCRGRQLFAFDNLFPEEFAVFYFQLLLVTGNPENCFSSLPVSVVLSSKKFMTVYNVCYLKRQNARTETTPRGAEWWGKSLFSDFCAWLILLGVYSFDLRCQRPPEQWVWGCL